MPTRPRSPPTRIRSRRWPPGSGIVPGSEEVLAVSHSHVADRIRNREALITVIGQGYVGLPLAVEFARRGFAVVGLDTDPARVAALNLGRPHGPDVNAEELK